MNIIHIDGDSFFASVEQARNPALRGCPIVVGKERGVVTAVSIEAKQRGVFRGMPIQEIKRLCPDIHFIASDYRLYSMVSRRMFAIVRRYCDVVDEYSVDECFAGIVGSTVNIENVAKNIQKDINRELGITISVGIASTKVLAKIASTRNKPNGFTSLLDSNISAFLTYCNCENVWGIGASATQTLARFGVHTAYQFGMRSRDWVRTHLSKPYEDIWHELQGIQSFPINTTSRTCYSLRSSRTFRPTSSRLQVYRELVHNIERVCVLSFVGNNYIQSTFRYL